MPAPIGAEVGLHYDSSCTVAKSDVIRTGTGRCYLITAVRRQEQGIHAGRWHLRAVVIDPDNVPNDAIVHPLWWYRR